ncbi:MAG: response regulator [Labilithrix sp.]|nr:response regulator [Labilithrix sp.]
MNLPAALSLASAVVGLAVVGVALLLGSSPRWARYRLLSVTAGMATVYCGLDVIATLDVRPDLLVTLTGVQSMAGALHVVMWHYYADRSLDREPARWERIARVAIAALAVGWLLPDFMLDGGTLTFAVPALGVRYQYATVTPVGAAMFGLEAASYLFVLVRFVDAARRGVEGATAHAAAIVVGVLAAIHDSLVSVGVYDAPFLLMVAFIGSVAALGAILTRAFIADARELDGMTQRLEQLVEERTKELVAAEAALMRAEKLAALGQLSAGVAHEINNPAAAVSANLEFLRDELRSGRMSVDVFTCIDDSLDAVARIAKIVRQLLDLGRASATAPVGGGASNVSRAVQRALATARASLRGGVVVSTEVADDVFVRGDEGSLVQVLTNLVVNAGQAIPESRGGRILLRAAEEGDDIVVTVTDDGDGMSDETRRRLFDPFYTTKPLGKGTGLGLSLSLGIARSFGGDLAVRASRPGETVMGLKLPIATAPSPTSSGRTREAARRPRLLIVEDDDRVRRALQRKLSSQFELAVAGGVAAAEASLDQQTFDVVLSDWKMACGGGRRLYELTAARRPDVASTMLFMTGGGLSSDDRSFIEERGMLVLEKPLAIDTLLAAVRRIETGRALGGAAPA